MEFNLQTATLSIVLNVVSTLVFIFLAYIYKRVAKKTQGTSLGFFDIATKTSFIIAIAMSIFVFFIHIMTTSLNLGTWIKNPNLLIAYSLLFGFSARLLYFALWGRNLRKAGIMYADSRIAKGITYKQSLNLCQTELRFLGTGASKLTANKDAFDDAVNRCCEHKSRSVKFLLCNPDSQALIDAARKANKPEDTYQIKVRDSLEAIRRIKQKHPDVEIRLYTADNLNSLPIFRLMFFNQDRLLASFNSYGSEHEGKELPRLLIRTAKSSSNGSSYYKPFDQLFDRLWQEGQDYA